MSGPHMRTTLRETKTRRTVGFNDAVRDLGTHLICGINASYSPQQVRQVLRGKSRSRRVLARIVERRPDLLDLSFTCEETRAAARALGWMPRETRGDRPDSVRPSGLEQL